MFSLNKSHFVSFNPFKYLAAMTITLLLVGCGGSSSEDSEHFEDQDSISTKLVNVEIADTGVEDLKILSSSSGEIDLSAHSSVNVDLDIESEIVMAIDESSDSILYFGFTGESESLKLNAMTTATSLIGGFPGLFEDFVNNKGRIIAQLGTIDEVVALANFIEQKVSNNGHWWDENDQELLDVIIVAIEAAASINESPLTASISVRGNSLKFDSNATKKQDYKPQLVAVEDTPSYLSLLSLRSTQQSLTYEVVNGGNRWVSVVSDDLDINYLLAPKSTSIPIELSANDFSSSPEGRIKIQSYGPGAITTGMPSEEWSYVIEPMFITMVEQVALPTLRVIGGGVASKCGEDWFRLAKDEGLLVNLYRDHPSLIEYAKNGDMNAIALKTLEITVNSLGKSALDCIAEKGLVAIFKKLNPLYAKVAGIWRIVNTSADLIPVLVTHRNSPVYKQWTLTNELTASVRILPSGSDSPIQQPYSGSCSASTICLQYLYQADQEMTFGFDVECLEDSVCKRVEWNLGDSDEIGNSDNEFVPSHTYTDFGDYFIEFSITDYDDANERKFFRLNLVEAKPGMELQLDGQTVTDGSSYFDFGQVEIGKGEVKQLFISNDGNAPLNINYIIPESGTGFSVTPSSAEIAPGESSTFQITFSPSEKGLRSSSISLGSNIEGSEGSVFTFYVNGEGIVPNSRDFTGTWFVTCDVNNPEATRKAVSITYSEGRYHHPTVNFEPSERHLTNSEFEEIFSAALSTHNNPLLISYNETFYFTSDYAGRSEWRGQILNDSPEGSIVETVNGECEYYLPTQ